jgi:ribosomal protein S12 methylthiotransferase accessory factor
MDEAAQALRRQLDYREDQPDLTRHRSALLRATARFRRVFVLRAPDAPNLVVLGADVDPREFGLENDAVGHVAGTGLDFRQAFEACAGEGVEYASQFARDDDPITLLAEDEALAGASGLA